MTTRVPSITYNWEEYILWEKYTAGTWIDMTDNTISNTWVTSVNWSTWAVTGLLTSSNISNTAYSSSWDWVTTTAPSKNAVYDAIEGKLWDIETLLANI